MEICIKGSPEEIAALITALQEQRVIPGDAKIYSGSISADEIPTPLMIWQRDQR